MFNEKEIDLMYDLVSSTIKELENQLLSIPTDEFDDIKKVSDELYDAINLRTKLRKMEV